MASKRKNSIFCQKKPIKKGMGLGAIHLGDENVWVLVKGKVYLNGWFRYWHNGKDEKVGPCRWRNYTGWSYEDAMDCVRGLNIDLMNIKNPKILLEEPFRFTWTDVVDVVDPAARRTVVAEEVLNPAPGYET